MFSDVLIHADPFEGVDPSRLPPPPEVLLACGRPLAADPPAGVERRRSPRYEVAAVALVRPIDTGFRPAGPAFRGVVRDVSAGGLRLLHTRYVGAHLLAVRLGLSPDRSVTVAMTVLRTQPRQGYYEIGGSILARLDGAEAGLV